MLTRLGDGTQVLIRPIEPADRDLLERGLAHLSEESIYARFFSPKPRFNSAELDYLTQVDGHDHFAVIAVRADDPSEPVAVARWVRMREERITAEAAIVVADAYQGQGLGGKLAGVLTVAAAEHGIRRFVATMLADNVAAHRLFASMTDDMRTVHRGAVDELEVPLAA